MHIRNTQFTVNIYFFFFLTELLLWRSVCGESWSVLSAALYQSWFLVSMLWQIATDKNLCIDLIDDSMNYVSLCKCVVHLPVVLKTLHTVNYPVWCLWNDCCRRGVGNLPHLTKKWHPVIEMFMWLIIFLDTLSFFLLFIRFYMSLITDI